MREAERREQAATRICQSCRSRKDKWIQDLDINKVDSMITLKQFED